MREQIFFVPSVGNDDLLGNAIGGRAEASNFDALGIAHEGAGEFANFFGESRREK